VNSRELVRVIDRVVDGTASGREPIVERRGRGPLPIAGNSYGGSIACRVTGHEPPLVGIVAAPTGRRLVQASVFPNGVIGDDDCAPHALAALALGTRRAEETTWHAVIGYITGTLAIVGVAGHYLGN
jgi:hypothetical protein